MTRQILHVRLLAVSVALGSLLLAACAQAGPGDGGPTPSPSAIPTVQPSTKQSGPVIPPPPDETVLVTGMVERSSLEGGCTVLRTDNGRTYELHGNATLFPVGNRMRVRGIIRTDLVSICQMGPILEVQSSEPV